MKNTRYLAGWEFNPRNPDTFIPFLKTQGVDIDGFNFFKSIQTAIEIRHNDDLTVDLFKHSEGEEPTLDHEGILLPLEDWPVHMVFFLVQDEGGRHSLGGKKPQRFILPHLDVLKTPFHYLGTLDGTDPYFNWLGVSQLHIAYPLNECNFGIYLDYSDPLNPKVLNPETFTDDWFDPEDNDDGELVFGEVRFGTTGKIPDDLDTEASDILLCGVPLWFQYPEIPLCPVTHEPMRFVCMLNSSREIKRTSEGGGSRNEYLCFGDAGNLYVFFHPVSRVMHLSVQF